MFCASSYGSIILIDAVQSQRGVRSILLPTKAMSYSSPVQSSPERRLVWGPPYKTSDAERAARGAFCRDLLLA